MKILEKYDARFEVETDAVHQAQLWRIRHASGAIVAHADGSRKALPIIEDGIVPPAKFHEFLTGVYDLFAKHRMKIAVWGHAGDANVHVQPFLDLSQVGDRQNLATSE